MDDECKHGLTESTCSLCRPAAPVERSQGGRAPSSRPWEPYRERYARRPETFEAYVDVWQRLSGAREFPGGWTAFSRAANAEPAMDSSLVQRAEELVRLAGYECGPKQPGVGRRWWRRS